ncbi:MAG: DNA-directed RNA polymerase subunit omega [Clostridia bacterium]|nr:DNA-directed RNA polymerase subunit omega [Clostridia bacterium]
MTNPDMKKLLKNNISRYSLVIATAKRARAIAEKAEEDKVIMVEKPVTLAVDEIQRGDYVVVEPEEIRNL